MIEKSRGPVIWLPKTTEIELPVHRGNVGGGYNLSGHLHVVMRDLMGNVVWDNGGVQDNLITNYGMSRLTNQPNYPQSLGTYLSLGDGTTTPAYTDTALSGSQLGARKVSSETTKVPTSTYVGRKMKFRWVEGEGVGTIGEIGLWPDATGGTIATHSRLVDGAGSPTTLVKGTDNILDVYYELRNAPVLTDQSGTFLVSGTSYDWTGRPYLFANDIFSNWYVINMSRLSSNTVDHSVYSGVTQLLALTDSNPQLSPYNGTFLGQSNSVDPDYDYSTATGNWYSTGMVEFSIDQGNGTINWFKVECIQSAYQFLFDKTVGGGGIVKTDEQRLRFYFKEILGRA